MKLALTLLTSLFVFHSFCQENYRKTNFQISKKDIVNPSEVKPDFHPVIYNLEAPLPGGPSARSYLMRQKIKSRAHYKDKHSFEPKYLKKNQKNISGPEIGFTLAPTTYINNNISLPIYGGIPSDNTLAVSNNGIILMAMNSLIYAYNMVSDTNHFPNNIIHLRGLINGSSFSNYYDPKLIYDPEADRFILTFLKDFTPDESEVIICFSSTNDPLDPWYVYYLPGNPLNNNRWTDFPCISVTEDKLYFTANLIIPNVSWQVGFDGSIIWEMDKNAGYTGANIDATLYSDIKLEGRYTRNLIPVQGANGLANEMIFLSNRNFDIENDTVFFIRTNNGTLDILSLKTDLPYGVPPNGRQFDTDTSDPTGGLQTNDARILGAIIFDDQIQFVGNTINPFTGYSAIYHGIIYDHNENPTIKGHIIGDSVRDFAYPNIAWAGNEACDREVIIGFNYSSFNHFPGIAAVYVDNDVNYSSVKTIKEGYNYVDRLPGTYERWGDFFGLQRKYNEEGTAFAFGFLALENKSNGGFCAQLSSPDTSKLHLNFSLTQSDVCKNTVIAEVANGTPPYFFYWNNSSIPTNEQIDNICNGDTLKVFVKDSRGCSATAHYKVPRLDIKDNINIYPNPVSDLAVMRFYLENEALIRAELYDMHGKLITVLIEKNARKGLNEFTFSMLTLSQGAYNVVLFADNNQINSFKIIKSF